MSGMVPHVGALAPHCRDAAGGAPAVLGDLTPSAHPSRKRNRQRERGGASKLGHWTVSHKSRPIEPGQPYTGPSLRRLIAGGFFTAGLETPLRGTSTRGVLRRASSGGGRLTNRLVTDRDAQFGSMPVHGGCRRSAAALVL